jgi:hypothetical protein
LADPLDIYSPIVLADCLLGFLFQQDRDTLRPGDVLVRPAVEGFTSLNFSPDNVAALIERGSIAADSTLARNRCLPRGPPEAARPLPRLVSSYSIQSRNHSERLALERLLGLGLEDSLDLSLLRGRVRHLAQVDAYQAVWLSPQGSGDSVSFHISVRRGLRRLAGLGLAYDNELGGQMWLAAVDRRAFNLALEASTTLFLGELHKGWSLGLRRNYQLGRHLMRPTITAQLATESVRQFTPEGDELDPVKTRDFGHGWSTDLGLVGHPGMSRTRTAARWVLQCDSQKRIEPGCSWLRDLSCGPETTSECTFWVRFTAGSERYASAPSFESAGEIGCPSN